LLTPAALLALVFRRKWLVLVSFLVLMGAAGAFVLSIPEEYEAELRLLVKRLRTESPMASDQAGAVLSSTISEAEINSEIELLWSRQSLEEVALRCHLLEEVDPEEREPERRLALAVEELKRDLSISRISVTNMIAVKYSDSDPTRAVQVVRTLAEVYLAKHVAVYRNQDTSEFFDEQISLHEAQLRDAQEAVADFRRRHRVSSLAAEKEATLRRQSDLEALLQDTESQIRDNEDRLTSLRAQFQSVPETIEIQSRLAKNEALIETLKSTLLELENKRTALLTKYDEDYRLVREVDQQIRDAREMLATEQRETVVDRTQAVNPLRQSLKADLLRTETVLAGLRAKRIQAIQDQARVRDELLELERITGEHDDLVRKVQLAEENYLLYRRRWEESRLADAMDQQKILNISVAEEPVTPALPSNQYKGFLMLLGTVLAGFGSLAVVLFTDQALPVIREAFRGAQANKSVMERPIMTPAPSKSAEEREESAAETAAVHGVLGSPGRIWPHDRLPQRAPRRVSGRRGRAGARTKRGRSCNRRRAARVLDAPTERTACPAGGRRSLRPVDVGVLRNG